ncbi:MAG: tRNA pseudouridine(55) synthase TruB [Bifidobacterium scardovii]|uniref:tRNA pseudouridine synthase B n=1 Tax=Bifidobacterium scardovii TaxID=158787 RepID=UPI0029012B4A|nr:tRNA pseudouridine(55) synthase TruB [Bifidobacterium scardovii]MDU2421376.1 tRNA pseudouridine(55) synthase TruB [Bifidobacterium scardovii]
MASQGPQPSGLLIVDKPRGVTSHDVVAAARGALHTKKVGHAGTLDPMATGVLVIGFGNATRLLNYIVDHDKTYEATIRLGQSTDTDDADGTPIAPDGPAASAGCAGHGTRRDGTQEDADRRMPDRAAVERAIAEHFLGDIEQVPNAFSAIKINGQRAYDLAREGKAVELKARPVTIGEFTVLDARYGYTDAFRAGAPLAAANDFPSSAQVVDLDVRVSCSSGTYIRALARDLGATLGVGGHLTRLRRTRVGRFALDGDHAAHAVTAHVETRTFTNRDGETVTRNRAVLDAAGEELLSRALTMADAVAAAMQTVAISGHDAAELRFGRRIPCGGKGIAAAVVPETGDVAAIVERTGRGEAKPVTVFAA